MSPARYHSWPAGRLARKAVELVVDGMSVISYYSFFFGIRIVDNVMIELNMSGQAYRHVWRVLLIHYTPT